MLIKIVWDISVNKKNKLYAEKFIYQEEEPSQISRKISPRGEWVKKSSKSLSNLRQCTLIITP